MSLSIRLVCALLLVCAAVHVSHAASSNSNLASAHNHKRSVNFTPSWGKRSAAVVDLQTAMAMAEAEVAEAVTEAEGRCLQQHSYVEFLLYKLRVSMLGGLSWRICHGSYVQSPKGDQQF